MKYRRPGRPPGPSKDRGKRPWDPVRLTVEEQKILDYVAAHPDEPRWQIAEHFGISPAHLSVLTCSPVGQRHLGVGMDLSDWIEASGLAEE